MKEIKIDNVTAIEDNGRVYYTEEYVQELRRMGNISKQNEEYVYHFCAKSKVINGSGESFDGLITCEKPVVTIEDYKLACEDIASSFGRSDFVLVSFSRL